MNKKGQTIKPAFKLILYILVLAGLIIAFAWPWIQGSGKVGKCAEGYGGHCGICVEGETGIYARDCFNNGYQDCCLPDEKNETTNINLSNTNNNQQPADDKETDYNENGFPYPMLFVSEMTDENGLPIDYTTLYAGEEETIYFESSAMHKDYQCRITLSYLDNIPGDRLIKEVNAPCIEKTQFRFTTPSDHIGEQVMFYITATYKNKFFSKIMGDSLVIQER